MTLARFVVLTIVGTLAGLVGGYIPATIALSVMLRSGGSTGFQTADIISKLVWFAVAGAIAGVFQRASGPDSLPRWWPFASAAGWSASIALASGARGSENNDLRLAIPASALLSLVVGAVLLLRRRAAPAVRRPEVRAPRAPSRFGGFRTGAAAIPAYLISVGAGHVALAQIMSEQATGPREGQAFLGTLVLGLMFVVLGLFAVPLAFGRGPWTIVRAALIGVVVAVAVVAYTASRGYEMGGVAGEPQCIVEQGREICPAGNGTYIVDARPDVVIMLLAGAGAYAVAHVLGRRTARPTAAMTAAG